jgi:hypothetical protein
MVRSSVGPANVAGALVKSNPVRIHRTINPVAREAARGPGRRMFEGNVSWLMMASTSLDPVAASIDTDSIGLERRFGDTR